jgi:phosphoribosylformylglycinamidine cyclo-ligase
MAKQVTYKTSGVDISKANAFVRAIQRDVKKTLSPSVIKDKGAFGSLFALNLKGIKNPVLVSSTDGVGTKLLIAQQAKKHDTVGIDLVAMNVNDILCVGARPLFFLDYIACGKVDVKVLKDVVKGITEGCRQAGCSLIGGETAEMPGLYSPQEYDLAGFAVGIVDKDRIVNGSGIKAGDKVIGLPSSGIHSNGYSLVRKVLSAAEQKKWSGELLSPTRIYAREVMMLTEKFQLRGIAHITGGAYYEKLTKILPLGLCFSINKESWLVPEIFKLVQKNGNVADSEMFRTFNMGIGMAFVVRAVDVDMVKTFLRHKRITFYEMGDVIKHPKSRVVFR